MKNVPNANSSISWWGIGLSILAANIGYYNIHTGASMGYTKGLAFGSFEWTAILVMIGVLLFVFPILMSTGVKTTPEYLGLRFNSFTRKTVAIVMVFLNVFVVMVPILYFASIDLTKWYGLSHNFWLVIFVVLITAMLISNNMLLLMRINIIMIVLMFVTGIIIMFYCFYIVGGIDEFARLGAPRINAFLPAEDDMLPWHSVVFGGLWIAHAYFWGFNPYIQQFILSAETLTKAQFGFLLAATLKLIVPFIVIVPGITLYIMKGDHFFEDTQLAFSYFITDILPSKFSGVVLIVFLSTMLSTFSSVSYSAINIILNDIIPKSNVTEKEKTSSYRIIFVLLMIVSLIGAYFFEPIGKQGLHQYNQIIMNSITPTIIVIFGLGLFFKRTTSIAANTALIIALPLFILLSYLFPQMDRLNLGGLIFLTQGFIMILLSYMLPDKNQKKVFMAKEIRFERHLLVITWSIILVTLMMSIYVILY